MSGVLAGRRLGLKPLADSDAPLLLDAVSASRVMLRRRFGWVDAATDADDIVSFIHAKAQAAETGRSSTFGIFDAKGGKVLGVVALDPIQRDTQKAQMTLWIRADEQAKGYAVEVGRLIEEHAFKKHALHRLYARIDPANRIARKVLQKLGFRYEGCLRQDKRLNNRWVDQECWGMLKADWKPQPAARSKK